MAASKTAKKPAPKKTAVKKVAKKITSKKPASQIPEQQKELGFKYSDKSAGQEKLVPIFNELRKLLKPYVKGSIKQKGGTGGAVTLVSDKEIVIDGRKKEEMHFAAALIQKGYVGFYFMPVYAGDSVKKHIGADLLKTLKGKACFHIKKLDDVLSEQIRDALKMGYDMYKKKGWID
jgi:hypothetical protein